MKTPATGYNEEKLHEVLKEHFPKQNDFYSCDYKKEVEELQYFKISTLEALRALLKKQTPKVLEIDRTPLSDMEYKVFEEEYGQQFVAERREKRYWSAFPALLRCALELEFGEAYEKYAAKRDGLD